MFDISILLLIPAFIISMIAQASVSSAFSKYSKIRSRKNATGAAAAEYMLQRAGCTDVKVERVAGNLTDHYDPRTKTLRLSEQVYTSNSLAAVGVAAHETGHAIQHHEGYVPLGLRSAIFPVVSIGSQAAMPVFFIGLLIAGIGSGGNSLGYFVMNLGILAFSLTVLFQLITLPVEFNASRRALYLLEEYGILENDEIGSAKKVLNAAASTYVAAAFMSIMSLLRLLLLSRRRR